MKFYHNARCGKSREGLSLLEDKDFEVIEYLKNPLTFDELKSLISKIGITPKELVRENEAVFKDQFKGKELSDEEWIKVMIKYPKLMERPILENGNVAIVGRPPELILTIC